jgi:hypothetical protein
MAGELAAIRGRIEVTSDFVFTCAFVESGHG